MGRLIEVAMALMLGLVLGIVTTPRPEPTPPPPAPAACVQLPADQVCPAWLFQTNLKAARRRICGGR